MTFCKMESNPSWHASIYRNYFTLTVSGYIFVLPYVPDKAVVKRLNKCFTAFYGKPFATEQVFVG